MPRNPIAMNSGRACLRRPSAGAALLALTLLAPPAALAARPFATEDAGVLATRDCELEPAWTRVRSQGIAVKAAVVQVACGVGGDTHLYGNVQRYTGAGERSTDFGIGGKTALAGSPDGPYALTLAYGANIGRGDGSSRRITDGFATLVLGAPLADTLLAHVNLGWLGERHPSVDSMFWALGLEMPVGGGFDLGAELYGTDRDERWIGLGGRWTGGDWSFNAGLARLTSGPKANQLTLGVKYAF